MFVLKGFLGALLFFIAFVAIVLAIFFHQAIKNLKIFRSTAEKAADRAARRAAAEEEYFRRTSNKYYQKEEKPDFGSDYFKGDDPRQAQEKEQKRTARQTTSSEGVTIIDSRDERAERKIFDANEGEYVAFEEV